jgi:hypothetical protein
MDSPRPAEKSRHEHQTLRKKGTVHAACRWIPFLIFYQLLSHIEKLRTSMIDDLNASNVFYKKRIEELGQRLQEQNELIITQKQQVCLGAPAFCFFK